MEIVTSTRKIGGSLAVIVPKEVVQSERIGPNDSVRVKIERVDDLSWWFGKLKGVKTPTQEIMKIIDEGEDDG